MSAKANALERIALLSREFLHRYWNGGTGWCSNCLAGDAVMLPLDEAAPVLGAEAICAWLDRRAATHPRIILQNERYTVSAISDTVFCATGTCTSYRSLMDKDRQRDALRLSLIWHRGPGGSLQLAYGHLSSCETRSNEQDHQSADKGIRRIVKGICAGDTQDLMLRDESGAIHFFNTGDVRYLEAAGRRTIVHHLAGPLCIVRGITYRHAQLKTTSSQQVEQALGLAQIEDA